MKRKNQSRKPRKGKRRQKMLAREEVQLLQNLQNTLEKKSAETKIPKPEEKPQASSSKTKNTEEKFNSDPKAPKMATTSSRRLQPVPEKLMNYVTEQDEEYFSCRETDDVFVSGKSRKK